LAKVDDTIITGPYAPKKSKFSLGTTKKEKSKNTKKIDDLFSFTALDKGKSTDLIPSTNDPITVMRAGFSSNTMPSFETMPLTKETLKRIAPASKNKVTFDFGS
jgi:hypothetical protein